MNPQRSLTLHAVFAAAALSATGFAGDYGKSPIDKNVIPADPWADAIRPITNPTLFDLAVPRTQLHGIFIHNTMPSSVEIAGGGLVPLNGDFQLYAVQFEYAFNDRLSLNATKDGYIVFDPDSTLADHEGFANVALGPKYAWLLKPEQGLASNFQLLYEIPMGNTDVWQGEGDGVFVPSMSTLKLAGNWQFANQFGFKLPVDSDAESTMFYTSAHVSYKVCEWIRPVVEVNWFRVIDEGDGRARFGDQIGGALPSVIAFEGGDLVNWGALNAGDNKDFVTGAVGFRLTPPGKPFNIGFAWETPLTDDQAGLIESRFTVDMVFHF